MNDGEIKCPHCGKTFKVDEVGYASILKQVRDSEFDKDLSERIHQLEKEKAEAVKLAEANTKNLLQKELSDKEMKLIQLKADRDSAISKLAEREKALKDEKENAIQLVEQKTKNELQKELNEKDSKLTELEAQIKQINTDKELAVTKAVAVVEKDRDELKIQLANKENEKQLIKENYETKIKDRDDAIERLKDMKTKLSTKMVGESLEQFCQNEFNKIRATAFPNAYFEKDNKVSKSSNSKGDFIFRDPAKGVESVSIMFDMKNENETTATKHKNEDFLAELNKDRNEKHCEYAILVSMLEADNDLYNQGIVDVSYRYPKMYVIRPQFFIPIITLLKNAAEKSLAIKNELAVIRNQNIDISTFEDDVNAWKVGWLATMKNAGKKHVEAVEQIDRAIKDLEKVRDALTLSNKHLLSAENKMDDLTVKHLTRKNPTMAAKFEQLKNE